MAEPWRDSPPAILRMSELADSVAMMSLLVNAKHELRESDAKAKPQRIA
ncbi:hypothetical protein [Suicoccus acidiformans]|nr:hypothetical protein [Suicoccus acidiformans]